MDQIKRTAPLKIAGLYRIFMIFNSFERSENVLYAVAQLTGGKIQNAIWPKIWMLIFILGQNKSKQAKKKFRPDPTRPGPARPDPA